MPLVICSIRGAFLKMPFIVSARIEGHGHLLFYFVAHWRTKAIRIGCCLMDARKTNTHGREKIVHYGLPEPRVYQSLPKPRDPNSNPARSSSLSVARGHVTQTPVQRRSSSPDPGTRAAAALGFQRVGGGGGWIWARGRWRRLDPCTRGSLLCLKPPYVEVYAPCCPYTRRSGPCSLRRGDAPRRTTSLPWDSTTSSSSAFSCSGQPLPSVSWTPSTPPSVVWGFVPCSLECGFGTQVVQHHVFAAADEEILTDATIIPPPHLRFIEVRLLCPRWGHRRGGRDPGELLRKHRWVTFLHKHRCSLLRLLI